MTIDPLLRSSVALALSPNPVVPVSVLVDLSHQSLRGPELLVISNVLFTTFSRDQVGVLHG